jgi:hypothetical protein
MNDFKRLAVVINNDAKKRKWVAFPSSFPNHKKQAFTGHC